MSNKCPPCIRLVNHKFSDCGSYRCTCRCVNEIFKLLPNQLEETISIDCPKFLNIDDVALKKLRHTESLINSFNKIRKDEWLKTKIDRRFRSKRKAQEKN
jgi:hypothetical protein